VGLNGVGFWLLLLILELLPLLFLVCLNRRWNNGGRLGLVCCDDDLFCDDDAKGSFGGPFDVVLLVDLASTVLLSLVTDREGDFGGEDDKVEERFTSTCCCSSSGDDDSWTLSNLVVAKPEVEETLYCDDDDDPPFL